ncbi:phosphotransferase enzyme family protein [Roseobacter sp. EG26]|uniref:phosphotransferase enzyme family protein n=1 Tax=Roseobacter sp. EG26 TaxID=3412477 RepID=UPI003CE533E5
MTGVVEKFLVLWGMEDAHTELVATRENHVYKVDRAGDLYALRLHRRGLRTDAELQSELQWMAAAGEGGLQVPNPVPTSEGAFLHVVDGIQVDMLTWLKGETLSAMAQKGGTIDRSGTYRAIGRAMAQLHEISDTWTPPETFCRWAWDAEGLLGDAPIWGRFWDNPTLTASERALLLHLRDAALEDLNKPSAGLDFGLIHADLVDENIVFNGQQPQLIDFDDGGFGYRLFDIAGALIKKHDWRDFDQLKQALIAGYLQVRHIDLSALDLFMGLRAASYVGWIVTRMQEQAAHDRNRRFIDTAVIFADIYLSNRHRVTETVSISQGNET